MLTPTGFESGSSYVEFVLAREFVKESVSESYESYAYERNWMEKAGHTLSRPFFHPLNKLIQNIKNPLMILALTVAAVALVSLLFYPAQSLALLVTVLPFLAKIQPWMLKGAVFVGIELTIASVGLRALGRVCNKTLRQAWSQNEILAVPLGGKVVLKD